MSKRKYYWRWVKTAFRDVLYRIDLWYGVGGAFLTALRQVVPSIEASMPDLVWQLLLWSTVAVVLARVILAPYWIAKEDAAIIHAQQREIGDLKESIKPRLAILEVVHEPPDLGSSMLTMKYIKIEVKNTGVEILQHCSVALRDLTSDKGQNFKPKRADLSTEMTFCAGETKDIEVAWLNEGLEQCDIELKYESRDIQRTVSRNDAYYFNLVAYSVGSPHSKRFKLYVDNYGRLRMEECPQ